MTNLAGYCVLLSALIWCITLILPWRPWGVSEQLKPDAETIDERFDLSDITVLIPARNEAEHIQETLKALQQQGRHHQILVIDDQSSDNTAQLAQQAGAEVISGTELPTGWTGKLWALQQGLQQVRTPLVLQLDADITLQPGMLPTLVRKLETENRTMVSIMALLPTRRFWQTLLLPAYVWFFKMLYPFALANGKNQRFAAAAGGCILLRADALRDIGEYHAIKNAVIDDCSLAAQLKQAGHSIWTGLSRSVMSRRASETLSDVTNLVARTAFTQLRYSVLILLVANALLIVVFWMPLAGLLVNNEFIRGAALLGLVLMLICYWPLMRFYQLNPLYGLLLPLTTTLYLGMTWLSAWRHWRGHGANWKDRHYPKM